MATQANVRYTENRSCYNCGQQGHISRFCPLPDKRLNSGQASTSMAIVPAQPLMTAPISSNGVSIVAPHQNVFSSGYSNDKTCLRNRVATLEEIVGKIKSKHDADEAKELATKHEIERRNKEKDEEERRLKDKQEREEQHLRLSQELGKQWGKICEKIEKRDKDANELAKLREDVARLSRTKEDVTPSQPTAAKVDIVDVLRREQDEIRAAVDRRFAMMEERINHLIKGKEAAEADVELWKAEALRSSNKRGSIAIETPTSNARAHLRSTPSREGAVVGPVSARTEKGINPSLKGIVDQHNMKVNLLKEMRMKDVNGRMEAEKEVEKLKAEMARLEISRRQKGTNLKTRLDKAAGASTYKPPCPPCSSSKKKAATSSAD
ncbi:hypothetical protein CBR_g50603 [Chara braunii]|uniref:CCHC-type domain-containing protein n=1 Tax=Chara braunii TaxID=69332 RepID=A0A388M766_CHABU|nr:hypothetical protein CBR_g50603 [Chara braunii]|eukprot:GBG90355.1 hypothetical protein CBR_g50603 [Chara braunii]